MNAFHRGRRAVLFLPLLATACTISRQVELFPTAPSASGAPPVLHGEIVGHGDLHGTAKITMADGEVLQGQYSIIAEGSMNFGTVFGTVYGARGGVGSATSSSYSVSGQGQGMASLAGDRGTSMQCEFLNNNMTGHGYGACKTMNGAVYRMIY